MKKRVLLCNEFSDLSTGYGVYGRELLSRLKDKYEVAELACNIGPDNPRYQNWPWKVFPNKPPPGSPELANYYSQISFEHGEFSFNTVLLNFKPHYVLDFRDPWMFEHQGRSPFRNFFRWIISPTIDAYPQNAEWVDIYSEADAVLTYSDFGGRVLKKQCPNINYLGSAYAAPSKAYRRFEEQERASLRASIGLKPSDIVIGTVMRNQPRKLFPDIFAAFKKVLEETGRKDIYLYAHTAFPDLGWNIPELLLEYEIGSRVLFTYKCKNCGDITVSTFHDAVKHCNNCSTCSSNLVGVGNSIEDTYLNQIYNLFDIYLQISTNEGFGIPVVEAASTGAATIVVNYSSMEDFVEKAVSLPVNPKVMIKEANTSRMFAVPNISEITDIICDLLSDNNVGLRQMQACQSSYSWDANADKWIEAIESLEPIPDHMGWNSPIDIQEPGPMIEANLTPSQQTEYLIKNVLKKPELMYKYLWRRLMKDLTYRSTIKSQSSPVYFHEGSEKDLLHTTEFNFKNAYELIRDLRNMHNTWEEHRRNHI